MTDIQEAEFKTAGQLTGGALNRFEKCAQARGEWIKLNRGCTQGCFDQIGHFSEKFGRIEYKDFIFDCPYKNSECSATRAEKRWEENLFTRALLEERVPEENADFILADHHDPITLACMDYLGAQAEAKFLVLFCKTGTGKSSRAAGVCREFLRAQRQAGKLEYELTLPRWAYMPDVVSSFEERYQNFEAWDSLRKSMQNASLLVIDDLGAAENEIAERKILVPILTKRADNNRATVITTQLSSALFQRCLGDRIASRIKQKAVLYRGTGAEPNWREEERAA